MTERVVIKVTQREVAAAKLKMTLDRHAGRESSEAVKAIANAKRRPREA